MPQRFLLPLRPLRMLRLEYVQDDDVDDLGDLYDSLLLGRVIGGKLHETQLVPFADSKVSRPVGDVVGDLGHLSRFATANILRSGMPL